MDGSAASLAEFTHVRIIVGMVTGLSITRLLSGMARFVQHPKRDQIHGLHLAWSLFLILAVIHFWWFEFALSHVAQWSFERYLFVLTYAALFFFVSSVLYPDKMDDYAGFADYFSARRAWIYGLLAFLFAVDIVDTAAKGRSYFDAMSAFYPWRQAAMIVLCLLAMKYGDKRYQWFVVVSAIATQAWWIYGDFTFLR